MRKFLSFTAMIAMIIGLVLTLAAPASAETITAEAHATSMDEASVAATLKAATVINTNASGKIVGAWAQNPSKHWAPSKAKKVRFVKSYAAGVKSCRPFRLSKDKWYPRTLKRRDGQFFQVKGGTRVKYAWSLFDVGANCQVRHRGYWNGTRWIGDCVNPKPGPNWPVYPPSMVVEVKQHTAIDYKLELDWVATAWVYGRVRVDCPDSWAESSFKSSGSVTGSSSLRISARSRTEAEAKARQQIALNVRNSTSIKASIMGSGEVAAEGEAKASCSSGDEEIPPAFVQFREVNDVYVNATTEHCVTVDTPAGHTATVYWTATFGSFATPQKTAQDGVQICSTYKAPSEVPVPSGGTDRITVRAVDNVTDLSVTQTTDPFVIKAMPGTPS